MLREKLLYEDEGGITLKIWKIEAEGDVVYVEAQDRSHAIAVLDQKVGRIPRHLITLEEVPVLPEGEELL